MQSAEQSAMMAIQPFPTGLEYHQPLLPPVGRRMHASSVRDSIQTVLLFPFRVLAAIVLLPLIIAWSAVGAILLAEEPGS
jgi:hypothetical protein